MSKHITTPGILSSTEPPQAERSYTSSAQASAGQGILQAQQLCLAYEDRTVINNMDISLPEGKVSVIIGPNGCGKSTLLRALAGLLPISSGQVLLANKALSQYKAKERARLLGLLPQSSTAPTGIRVADLVARGRFPHQGLLRQWSEHDAQAVEAALTQTQLLALADRPVADLSGGQRQRVWLALVLAQEPDILLLDEPTTYLDIAHQYEVLELCKTLNREQGKTLVMVLHDLNQAARYADHLIAMKSGELIASGPAQEVIQPALIEHIFGMQAIITPDPVTSTPMVVPERICATDGTAAKALT